MTDSMQQMQVWRQDGKLYALNQDTGRLEHVGWLLPQVKAHREELSLHDQRLQILYEDFETEFD